MTQIHRRSFLKSALATAVVATAAGAGLLTPRRILAAEWPKDAFAAESVADALKGLYGNSQGAASSLIKIKAPIQAENGAIVPITVSTSLPNVQSISVMVEKNPHPLVANVNMNGAEGHFSVRIKMGSTSDVHCAVRSGNKLYTAKQTIKVTVGGCGG